MLPKPKEHNRGSMRQDNALCESFKNLIPLASRQGAFQMCVSAVGQQGEAWCRVYVWGSQ